MIDGLHFPEFDEEKHAFKVNGNPVDGVTAILRSTFGDNPYWTKAGRDAGKATHKAIHYFAENDLDIRSLSEETKRRLDAYIRFCQEMDFKPDLLELPLYRESPLYCGIPDQGVFGHVIVDFKNGPVLPEVALQLAAYAHFMPNPLKYERWGVHLGDDGKYKLKPFPRQELPGDWVVFQSCINTHNWRKRCQRQNLTT